MAKTVCLFFSHVKQRLLREVQLNFRYPVDRSTGTSCVKEKNNEILTRLPCTRCPLTGIDHRLPCTRLPCTRCLLTRIDQAAMH